jgi:hypothetical protein
MPIGTGGLSLFLNFIRLFSLSANYFPRNLSEIQRFRHIDRYFPERKKEAVQIERLLFTKFSVVVIRNALGFCFDFIKNLDLN